jgi:hypothetical protein
LLPEQPVSEQPVSGQPVSGQPVSGHRTYANPDRGPAGSPEGAINANDGLTAALAPSPQVSALGSIHHDDVPSRSISEVTRPDDKTHDASSTASLCQGSPTRADHEASLAKLTSAAEESRQASPPAPLAETYMASPSAGGNMSAPTLEKVTSGPQHTTSSGSSYSQPTPVTPFQARSTQTTKTTPHDCDRSNIELLKTGLEARRSVVSAISNPSPEPQSQEQNGLSLTAARSSVSPAQPDTDSKSEVLSVSSPTGVPPYEDATPPYSAAMNIKEAEGAAERSALACQDDQQTLPAYQSPIQERAPPPSFQPSAVVPVADLSARRRNEDGRTAPARPFSFVDTHPEDISHRHTPSKESLHSSRTESSLIKELGLEGDEADRCRYSQMNRSPLGEADLGQHPALRGSMEKPLPSQNRNLAPPQRSAQRSPSGNAPNESPQQYRIPGPYGQQFKSTQLVLPTPSNPGRIQLQRPPNSAPAHPSLINHRPMEEQKKERHGSLFKSRNKLDSRTSSGQSDNTEGNTNTSKSAVEFYQRSSDTQAHGFVQNGTRTAERTTERTKEKEQKGSKKLQRLAPSKNQPSEHKKKGGFLRLSGLFSKSSKDNLSPAREEQWQRSASTPTRLASSPWKTPGPASSPPYQGQQHATPPWRGQDPHVNAM